MGKARILIRPTSLLRKKTGIMYKLFNLWQKEKNPLNWQKNLHKQPTTPPQPKEGKPVFLTQTLGLNSKYVTRRQIMLNRHFTEIISDVLVSNYKEQLDQLGVNITSIESKAWNKGVDVFYSTEEPFDEETHKKLNSLVRDVRLSITERQLIGRTPPVNFIYDEAVELERALKKALDLADVQPIDPSKELVEEVQSKRVVVNPRSYEGNSKLDVHNFDAPPDMTNMALGLDYKSMYNKVATKLERGRGQSERMPSSSSIASAGPVINLPSEETVEKDPTERIIAMQKFVVNQRKKKEFLARIRRKEELLLRDAVKWDVPDDDDDLGNVDQPVNDELR